jgi:hypothetical protein
LPCLTPQQLEQFDRDGYLLFPSLFTPAEIAPLLDEVPRLYAQQRPENVLEKSGVVRTNFAALAIENSTAIRQFVSHETMQAWFWDVWSRMRIAMEADAAKPNGRTVAFLEGALADLGAKLEADPAARLAVQAAAEAVIGRMLPSAQEHLSGFIATVVGGWDTGTLVERLELRVGPDLQYVRMNGTLVGFLVGGVLFAVLEAVFGHVAF